MRRLLSRYRDVLIGVGATLAAILGVGAAIVSSGAYNVAASSEHFAVTHYFLQFAMRRSVATYSLFTPHPPQLDDPDLIQLGAAHYLRGCAFCHGAPGDEKSPIVEKMLPAPPSLAATVDHWSDAELFRIVGHGLKYTGMPAWPAPERADEVWALVAFLRKLPGLQPQDYHALAAGNARADSQPQDSGEDVRQLAAECARCHDDAESSPTSRLAPALVGQRAEYLLHALNNYASGARQSGMMQHLAAELDDEERLSIAGYYARLASARKPRASPVPDPKQVERGRQLATVGVPDKGIPPCLGCHSGNAAASFPLLYRQQAAYLVQQLNLWRYGLRDRTPQGAIMALIARRLTEAQIADVATFFENIAVDEVERMRARPSVRN